MKTNMQRLFASSLALALLTPAIAGTLPDKSVVIPPAPPEKAWWVSFASDTWLSRVDGDIGIKGLTAPADMSLKDLLDELDFAYMGRFEIGYKRWSFSLDTVYAKLSTDTTFSFLNTSGKLSLEQEQIYATAHIQYRAVQTDNFLLELFVGARWTWLDVDTDLNIDLGYNNQFDLSEDWVDPIIGVNIGYDFTDKCFLHIIGDIGGFGVSSELTWQAFAGVGYRFTRHVSAIIGYRALGVDYDKHDFKLDTVTHGPVIVLGLKF